jgi:TorA maturation chaperone TorD
MVMAAKNFLNRAEMSDIAGRRAGFYEFLAGGWHRLPESSYLEKVKGLTLNHFIDVCCQLGGSEFKKGAECIRSYRILASRKSDAQAIEELSVDRTRILRGTGHSALMPPYEGLYKGKKNTGQPLLEIKQFYRKAGMILEDSVSEAPDFICVQLDFMKHMCRREQQQWSSDAAVTDTIGQEEAFLKNHLGSWVNDFCRQVKLHAQTEFYRGMAMIMDAFIVADMSYLEELNVSLS